MESMEARKLAIISGLYSNSNLDDGKNTRQKMIGEIEENFREAIIRLYDPLEETDQIKDNPFFDAINVPGGDIDWEEFARTKSQIPEIALVQPDEDLDQN